MNDFIPDIAARRAALAPHKVAFHDLVRRQTVTYAQLEQRSARAAGLLEGLGVGEGDRVALLCRNRVEFFELLFACAKLGAVLAPLNWRMPVAELSPLMADTRPRVLLYGAEDAGVAGELQRQGMTGLALDGEGAQGYLARRDGAQPHAGRPRWPGEQCWYLLFTSGTTGKPKAVIQTYRMALANYVNIRQAMGIGGADTTLNYLPLFHTAGINLVTLPTLMEGGRVLVSPDFDAERIIGLLRAGQLDTFFAVPAVYQQLSLHPAFGSLDLARVRSWGCGGAPMPDELLRRYIIQGARVCNGMGMTETGPTVFLMDPENVTARIGSVGKPQMLASVRLVDGAGRDVPRGEPGELWFAGPGITPGYWGNEQATAEAFSDDGWLRSGDIGRQDEDGYYYIVGRIKDMYISGGENVYPAEVENVLAGHPAILEAAVIGVPDRRWGEVGRAYLLARPGEQLPGEQELVAYCRQHLAPYKVPKGFVQVDEFPRTAAGKVQKHLLGGT